MSQENMSIEELKQELARLMAENAQLKARGVTGSFCKVSNKGAVSVYGIGSLPVTLYKEQWRRLIARGEEILKFITANESVLKSKPEGFKTIRDVAEEQGLDSVSTLMLQRMTAAQKELTAKVKAQTKN